MRKKITKQLLILIPVLFGITIISFSLIQLAPGDAVDLYVDPDATFEQIARSRQALGLDQPVYIQYFKWLGATLTGDLGISFSTRQPVADILMARLGTTLILMLSAMLLAYLVAIPVGIICSLYKNSWFDRLISSLSLIGVSIPNFFLAMGLIYIFSLRLQWLPTSGIRTLGGPDSLGDYLKHMILPVFVISLSIAGNMIRYVRARMLDVFQEDYIRTATAKGLSTAQIIRHHSFRNVLISVVTIVGLDLPRLLAGAVVIEQVFQYPGLGQLTISAISSRDYPILMAVNLLAALIVLFGNTLVDFLYYLLDPRIKIND